MDQELQIDDDMRVMTTSVSLLKGQYRYMKKCGISPSSLLRQAIEKHREAEFEYDYMESSKI